MSTEGIAGRALVDEALFGRLAHRVAHDRAMEQQFAERVVDQALAFLATCAANPAARLAPSRLVDHGWHAFLAYTREYAGFCDRVAGRFLHHNPEDGDRPVKGTSVAATMAALTEVGYQVDASCGPRSPTAPRAAEAATARSATRVATTPTDLRPGADGSSAPGPILRKRHTPPVG
ncbi:glycine-rich domain-containing protein [Kitasatospora sp. NPDC094011]|uniref:glycine-rich domain-containing protein n=1 Tax=Kitasatospora sp. NPDC094011 TaxID=3364090 RepID=UPI003809394E